LIILVPGVSTFPVSTLFRKDDRIKSEESNFALNGRTAQTIQTAFEDIQSNSFVFIEAYSVIKSEKEKESPAEIFFRSNHDVLFVSSAESALFFNPSVTDYQENVTTFLTEKEALSFEKTAYYNASPFSAFRP